jgi:predicted nucleic acid-binding protein
VILVDTSVWVDHLRRRNSRLAGLLDQGQVGCHPFVIGELALGGLKHRARVLDLLTELPIARTLGHQEVLAMVEERALPGSGIGWVDAHLLASALVERWPLWTLDRRLDAAARRLGTA